MKEQIGIDDVKGKTIESVVSSWSDGQVAICFTDNTFTLLEALNTRSEEGEIAFGRVFDPSHFGERQTLEAGIWTEEEIEDYARRRRESDEKRHEEMERNLYERLKAKFERGVL